MRREASVSRMVSARVPDAVFEQVHAKLKEIGSSTSDLINSAFEHVLEKGSLPACGGSAGEKKERKLSEDEASRLRRSFAACSLDVDVPDDIAGDKLAAHASRAGKHEAFA